MGHIYGFERLQVWQDIRVLVKKVYILTSQFPQSERYGLTNQIRRCAISIASNIAEGSGRNTPKDQAYFYGLSYASSMELLSQMIIASDLEFINESDLHEIRTLIEPVSNRINGLRRALLDS